MKSSFRVGDLVRWKPEVLKNRFGIVVEVTKLSVFVAWVGSSSRSGFNHYNACEAIEIINVKT
tara:strand:- start:1174 stop:1362 length:189 start_codon:yes stop_codon:yes gene_type:complete